MPDAWDPGCEPVRVAIETDRDPGAVLRALGADRLPFALVGGWAGGGAIVGSEPTSVLAGREVLDPPQPRCERTPAGIVGGGWIGHFGYGLAREIERLPAPPPRPQPLPSGQLAFYDHLLHLDADGRWWLEALWPQALERALPRVRARLAAPEVSHPWRLGPLRAAGAGASGHRAAVAECVERIASGELFQANVCLRLQGRFEGSPLEAFVAGAERLKPALGAFVSLPDGALLSFSPELFLRRCGRHVETAPIKGTLPRASDPDLAQEARRRLESSAKDAAEHVMIVDLMRNDLGRVARYGTVAADPQPRIEPHPGLWHLVTTVSGELRAEVSDGELLRATFPPGSVTGAPKVQALKVISELEGTAREAYTGAIGILSPVSGLELNVAIRTVEVRGSAAWLGCGGGIVADSDPERELREALDKAAPIAEALGSEIEAVQDARPPGHAGALPASSRPGRLSRRPEPALGLYETLRVRDGRAVDLESHLRRLAAGLDTGYGLALPGGLREQVHDAAARAGARARLRIAVRPGCEPTVETASAAGRPEPLSLTPITVTGGLGDRKLADREPLVAFEGPGRAGLICDIDGEVLEATSANVWAVLDGELLTPPADGRLLAGVTRAGILELGALAGLAIVERPLTLGQLRQADAILVSSSVRIAAAAALAPVSSAGGARERPTELAERLAVELRAALERGAADYPPAGGSTPPAAADWSRPAQTALAPRSPTLNTM